MKSARVVVLGGGPAGAAVAIGLHRMGQDVLLVGEPRRFAAVEGVSLRVIEALRKLGLVLALEAFAPPSPRCVSWNGVRSEANTETLVDRQHFDRAVLDDLERLGVPVLRGHVQSVSSSAGCHRIEVCCAAQGSEGRANERLVLEAAFLVEARGRAAPGSGLPRVRGVESVSLLQYWQGPAGAAQSAVESCEDGWVWMAALADGRRYLQLTLDVASAELPVKRMLGEYCGTRFRAIAAAAPFVRDARAVGQPHARTSTAILNENVVADNWIRVGDAAMAVDPLSGNGIFQSLSSALQAPAVVATLMDDPARADLARQFHQQRIEHLFYRFARIGRDFYAQETRWPGAAFWAGRRTWPDVAPLHEVVTPSEVSIARRPVVRDGRIVEQEVVLTPDQPLGVWHLDGVPLPPLLRLIKESPVTGDAALSLQRGAGLGAERAARIVGWMRAQGWIS